MPKLIKSFQMVSDAAHGWLKVPVVELERIGIAGDITPFSYRKGDMAFLEEDLDATLFMEKRKERGEVVRIKEINRENCNRIRNYAAYTADTTPEVTDAETVETDTESTEA